MCTDCNLLYLWRSHKLKIQTETTRVLPSRSRCNWICYVCPMRSSGVYDQGSYLDVAQYGDYWSQIIKFFYLYIAIIPQGLIVFVHITEESSDGMWARSVKTLIERNIKDWAKRPMFNDVLWWWERQALLSCFSLMPVSPARIRKARGNYRSEMCSDSKSNNV